MQIQLGDKTAKVKEVQEWLNLHQITVAIDSDFGPATEAAVKVFQVAAKLNKDANGNVIDPTGIVDDATWAVLVLPMTIAMQEIEKTSTDTLQTMLIKYAQQHLAQKPQEIGGDNRGPWVRLYLNAVNTAEGNPWCAAFASYCMQQASKSMGVSEPIKGSAGCASLASEANAAKSPIKHLTADQIPKDKSLLGSLFLVKIGNDYDHTGIVCRDGQDVIYTIEGNAREPQDTLQPPQRGYKVCQRIRNRKNLEYILLG
jgi:hypothetical protein